MVGADRHLDLGSAPYGAAAPRLADYNSMGMHLFILGGIRNQALRF